MEQLKNYKYIRSKVLYTMVMVLVLVSMLFFIVNYVFTKAEADAFELLHLQTKEIKENIEIQVVSDMENLSTMANFAAKLYSDGESYDLIFNSFEAVGLIKNIGILTPENKFLTKMGEMEVDRVSFDQEMRRGEYISGRVSDMTSSEVEVIRCAVPIKVGTDIVGILYGVIDLEDFEQKYKDLAEPRGAKLYVVERGTGYLLVDTRNEVLGHISDFSKRKEKPGYSYEEMYNDLLSGQSGFSAYEPRNADEYFYVHYSPMAISDWQIMVAKPETVVFEAAMETESRIFIVIGLVVAIMAAYLLLMFASERKHSTLNLYSSKIRKLLLEINQHHSSIIETLEIITYFSKARSSFYVDNSGVDYLYINPQDKTHVLSGEEKEYFLSRLIEYVRSNLKKYSLMVGFEKIVVNNELRSADVKLYEFLKSHTIRTIYVSGIMNKQGSIGLIGVINSNRYSAVKDLLKEIAVCFSMAVNNKKHLNKTEKTAVTDSLTGLSNRVAYNKDVAMFNETNPRMFSCVYIDVNELHSINNRFGHAAGDRMLCYIADELKVAFAGCHMYRMGGDEFLVFVENTEPDTIDNILTELSKKLDKMEYHISVGVEYKEVNTNTENMVMEAEKRMYKAKAEYYQSKGSINSNRFSYGDTEHIKMDMPEYDSLLSAIGGRYRGVYKVSLDNDTVTSIIRPANTGHKIEDNHKFSDVFSCYVQEMVNPDYHRPLLNFLKYEVLENQHKEGIVPSITYLDAKEMNITLSVYPIFKDENLDKDTLWVFEYDK